MGRLRRIQRAIYTLFHTCEWEVETPYTAKRWCKRCGRRQWLMTKPFFVADEPQAEWRDMS